LWIGNARSTTALHKDNYENIYVQVRGRKHFVLLPPVEMPCVNEQPLPLARYEPKKDSNHHDLSLVIASDEASDLVPVATWDPDDPNVRKSSFSDLANPLRVTLNEGDMLYLPAM
jgi:peptidyl-lysine (3S)-dioxygenase / protease